jgi:hypothetical protein
MLMRLGVRQAVAAHNFYLVPGEDPGSPHEQNQSPAFMSVLHVQAVVGGVCAAAQGVGGCASVLETFMPALSFQDNLPLQTES